MGLPNAGYFRLSDNAVIRTIYLNKDILVDVDVDGRIIGIETIGKEFSLEVAVEVLRSFVYPEVITLPTGKPIMFRV